jgi:excisionase family DNA binding protein
MANDLLTTDEVAKHLKRSRRWVQNIILRGQLKAEKMGSVYVVALRDVKGYRHRKPGSGTRRTESPKRSSKTTANGLDPRLTNQADKR